MNKLVIIIGSIFVAGYIYLMINYW